jgi:NAD(P)-dependent dehydrogenase (short-subunit alcohol dehydrogenase family)
MGMVQGKSGLVTGAAGGIGRASAILLAREGAAVVVSDVAAKRSQGEETVALIAQEGGRAVFAAADVTVESDQERLVEACVTAYGRLDFAHNNAGVDLQATLEDTELVDFRRVIDVNLKGVWLGLKHQIRQMREQGSGGSIVNTASLGGLMAIPTLGAYVASKHGVIGLTRAAALEVADAGIRVNAVLPATTRTPMLDELPPERIVEIARPHAIKRLCEPEEIAEAVLWLVSDRSSVVTGSPFRADLGLGAGVAAV